MAGKGPAPDSGPLSPPQVSYESTNNIENIGNITVGVNYGNIVQTWEVSSLPVHLPIHPDVGTHLPDCFPNSRSDDEAHIMDWLDDKGSELVLCVLGKVGVGKSTLAKHLSGTLRANSRLAGEAYFSFASPDWTPETVVRMLASQLAKEFPVLRRGIYEALRNDGGPSVSVQARFTKLILAPIQSLQLPHPLVVVFDALDQWQPHLGLIKALKHFTLESHLIRFLVMGRPGLEAHFQAHVVSLGVYNLRDVSKDTMAAYVEDRFSQIHWERGRKPHSRMIEQIVEKADGFFIWSSTLCSLLEDDLACPTPHQTLDAILRSQQTISDNNDTLASLYHDVITLHFRRPEHQSKLKVLLGALLVLQEPLPVDDFASLLGMEASLVQNMGERLKAFRTGDIGSDVVYPASSTFHLSLREYLENTRTPPHISFTVNTLDADARLGEACLKELHRSPFDKEYMPPLLKYATRFWPLHTARGTPEVTPDSNTEWKATPHATLLNKFSPAQWRQWASAYLKLVDPDLDLDTASDPNPNRRAREHKPARERTTDKSSLPPGPFVQFSIRIPVRLIDGDSGLDFGDVLDRNATIDKVSMALTSKVAAALTSRGIAASQDSIHMAQIAVRLQRRQSRAWWALGGAYWQAVESSLESSLLDSAIRAFRYAVQTLPRRGASDHPYKGGDDDDVLRANLSQCLWKRYELGKASQDLDEALSLDEALLTILPKEDPRHSASLSHLAVSLRSDFYRTGKAESLYKALSLYKQALSLQPADDPMRVNSLNNFAVALRCHFTLTGAKESLEEAISLYQEVLTFYPPGDPGRWEILRNLGLAFAHLYDTTHEIESIDRSISFLRESLLLCPPRRQARATVLNTLSWCLTFRFEAEGIAQDLEESISMARQALEHETFNIHNAMDTLAMALRHDPNRLEEALSYSREAAKARPPDWEFMMGLATVLLACHEQSPNLRYVEEAHTVCLRAYPLCLISKHGREKLVALKAEALAILKSLPTPG